jgi:toxin YoeB
VTPLAGNVDPHRIGKPEALKHSLSGCWSRRIDETNRLVYQVADEELVIISCRYHY